MIEAQREADRKCDGLEGEESTHDDFKMSYEYLRITICSRCSVSEWSSSFGHQISDCHLPLVALEATLHALALQTPPRLDASHTNLPPLRALEATAIMHDAFAS